MQDSAQNTADAVVIGAGIAGLTCAALLARSGLDVILLEAHDKVGGCAGYFDVPSKWGDFRFPTGATAAVGMEEGGLHRQIFEMLGVECHAIPIPGLKVFLPDFEVEMHHDAGQWQQTRRSLPGNSIGQELFWKLQELLAGSAWFSLSRKPALPLQNLVDLRRNLALADPRLLPLLTALPFSLGEAMKWLRVDRDRAFCALVNLQLLITTQSLSHAAPLVNGMAGIDLWRHGAFHPVGGMGSIAQKLLEGFEKFGGRIRFGWKAASFERTKQIWDVISTEGEVVRARHLVANVPIWNLKTLLKEPPDTCRLEQRAGSGWGAVNLYAAVRDEAIGVNFPLHAQVLTKYHPTPPFVKPGIGDDVFLSLSHPGDDTSAPTGWRALNVSTHVRWQEWQGLARLDYRAKKKLWRDKLLEGVRVALPDFDAGRGFVITATPSTWEHYTHRLGGSVGGAALTRRNANLRALPSRIDLEHFHLVGDTTFPGQGTVACALSGLNAWRDITGQ
jgi:C-3',4' desaturase CrtD